MSKTEQDECKLCGEPTTCYIFDEFDGQCDECCDYTHPDIDFDDYTYYS